MIINQIQGGRWDTFLRRLLPIKDRSIAPIMASELVGYITVQEWSPEFYMLRDEKMAIGLANQGAVAAEFAHCKIRNPDLSGNLVILEQIWINPSANSDILIAREGIELAGFAQAATAFRDSRAGQAVAIGETVAQVSTNSDAAALGGAGITRLSVNAIDSLQLKFPMVLEPGTGLIVREITVNIALRVTFVWRERVAEPSELLIA